MSDYDYDAFMDEIAEQDAEYAMEEYIAQMDKYYNDNINSQTEELSPSSPAKVSLIPLEPKPAWSEGQSTPTSETTENILQKIENDAEQQIHHLLQQNAPICAETCVNIMKHGADVFKEKTGRNMSYSEMRNAFG